MSSGQQNYVVHLYEDDSFLVNKIKFKGERKGESEYRIIRKRQHPEQRIKLTRDELFNLVDILDDVCDEIDDQKTRKEQARIQKKEEFERIRKIGSCPRCGHLPEKDPPAPCWNCGNVRE